MSNWSEFFFVPGMSHCGGGQALDQLDLLGAIVNWVEKGTTPALVIATGKRFRGERAAVCLSEACSLQGSKGIPNTRNPSSAVEQDGFHP